MKFGKSSYPEFARRRFQKRMEDIQKKLMNLREFSSDVKNMDRLLDEIDGLKDLELLGKLTGAYDMGVRIYGEGVVRDDFFNSHLMMLAKRYLNKPFSTSPMAFLRLSHDYKFFEYIYYMNSGKPLSVGDMEDLYYGGLGERVMLLLEKFDEAETAPSIDAEFFKALMGVRWQRKSKNLFNKITPIFGGLIENISRFSNFFVWNNLFLTFLCFCGAAADGRSLVSEVDVVRAFRAYIKLMRTDVTRYKAMRGFVEPVGFLVCDKCGGYYSLLPGESPEDFSDVCECGGRWEYRENPDYSSGFGGSSSLIRRLRRGGPVLFLRISGVAVVVVGVLFGALGYLGSVKFALMLPVGVVFIISGLLPFIFIHRSIAVYYAVLFFFVSFFCFSVRGYFVAADFLLLGVFLLVYRWKFL